MKTTTSIVMIVSVAFAMAACQRGPSPVSPTTTATVAASDIAQTAAKGKSTAVTVKFGKVPSAWAAEYVSTGPDVKAFVFYINSTGSNTTSLTQMAFMITGSLQTGDLVNFRLLYYPNGLTSPGVVLGANDGSTWTPGPAQSNFMRINLPTPFTLTTSPKTFTGLFALVLDIHRTTPFVFNPQLQTVNAIIGGVNQPLINPQTSDLPLAGNTFYVNGFSY